VNSSDSAQTESAAVLHRGVPVRERAPLGRLRKMMARSMAASVGTAALSQVTRQMDLSAVRRLRETPGAVRHSLNTWLLAAVAHTLTRHPLLNAELVDDAIVSFDAVNLGMAVATPDGLVVPVIHNANRLSLAELDGAAADVAARARSGKLTLPDIEGGTFTVSNLGMLGIDGGFPLPRPPEGAILLVGRATTVALWEESAAVPRDLAWFSLTFDHRFIDGAAAAAFLDDLQQTLLDPPFA
jgi:pyruvate dehydrogenase E2 component (dihydrolipoamide acetyltransferase)